MKRLKYALRTAAVLVAAAVCAGCANSAPEPEMPAETTIVSTDTAVTVSQDNTPEETTGTAAGYIPHSELLDCLYYDDSDFYVYNERSKVYDTDGAVLCGVAPHHLAAGHFIAGMYRTAAETRDDIETVVLIAPMHYDTLNPLCTSFKSRSTAFGIAETDTEITQMFVSGLGAAEDDYMTEFDHSASSHIPFIKYYLPDAKIACLLVSPKERADIPQRLSKLLYEISQKKSCLFAFSIDFSHYLDPPDANAHDKETNEAVLSGNTGLIETFTNSNVDTPYCLSTFVRLSALLGGKTISADNGNTFTVGSVPYSRSQFPEGVTSYFVFLSCAERT